MHDAKPCPGRRRHIRKIGLTLQAVDVIDDMRTGGNRQSRGLGPVGIDGDDRIGSLGSPPISRIAAP
jgi:hypothetical protein